jgi:hypothetical protein
MTPHHWAFADARFETPAHWREWLGATRTEEVEGINLFLLSRMRSQACIRADNAAPRALRGPNVSTGKGDGLWSGTGRQPP